MHEDLFILPKHCQQRLAPKHLGRFHACPWVRNTRDIPSLVSLVYIRIYSICCKREVAQHGDGCQVFAHLRPSIILRCHLRCLQNDEWPYYEQASRRADSPGRRAEGAGPGRPGPGRQKNSVIILEDVSGLHAAKTTQSLTYKLQPKAWRKGPSWGFEKRAGVCVCVRTSEKIDLSKPAFMLPPFSIFSPIK